MIESLTIFCPGGLIYYQYIASPSLFRANNANNANAKKGSTSSSKNSETSNATTSTTTTPSLGGSNAFTEYHVNTTFINKILVHPTPHQKQYYIQDGITFVWTIEPVNQRFYIVLLYPDIIFEGPRLYLQKWATELVNEVCTEYKYLFDAEQDRYNQAIRNNNNNKENTSYDIYDDNSKYNSFVYPDPALFDKTFRIILANSKAKGNTSQSFPDPGDETLGAAYDDLNTNGKFTIVEDSTTTSNDGKLNRKVILSAPGVTSATAGGIGNASSGGSHLPQHMLVSNNDTDEDNPFRMNAADRMLQAQQQQQKQPLTKDNMKGGSKKKQGKEKRNWHDGNAKVTEKAMAELDYSANDSGTPEDAYQRALQEARAAYLPTDDDLVVAKPTKKLEEDEKDAPTKPSFLSSIFQTLTLQNKVLTDADLQGPCDKLRQQLQSKNVANKIAIEVCNTVQQQLVGKTLKTFYSIETAIQQAVEDSIEKIVFHTKYDLIRNVLTKKESATKTNLLSRLSTNKSNINRYRPYVISVMGINGIGKTTTVAKIAYYLQQNSGGNIKPMLVACDTFRSGAVEQLKIHADCLNIPFYSQGYSKDPSLVATKAIQSITQSNAAIATAAASGSTDHTTTGATPGIPNEYIDVILIDTAGRMQNNVPLMKALNKLVVENQPDCCLLVCEALVGHDGLNQYEMFAKAAGSHGIDGLVLTKYDTVDTKVGATLSITYETATPILFVGTGQKYHHLQKLTSHDIVSALFAK